MADLVLVEAPTDASEAEEEPARISATIRVPLPGGGFREEEHKSTVSRMGSFEAWWVFIAMDAEMMFRSASVNTDKVFAAGPESESGEDHGWRVISLLHDALLLPVDAALGGMSLPHLHPLKVTADLVRKVRDSEEKEGDGLGWQVLPTEVAEATTARYEAWWRDDTTLDERASFAYSTPFAAHRQIHIAAHLIADTLLALRRAHFGERTLALAFLDPAWFDLPTADLATALSPANAAAMAASGLWRRWRREFFLQHVRCMVGLHAVSVHDARRHLDRAAADGRLPGLLAKEAETMLPAPFACALKDDTPEPRPQRDAARRALRRSLTAHARAFGPAAGREVQDLLARRRQEIVIRGARFDWSVADPLPAVRQGVLLNSVHCPFRIELRRKGDGAPLTRLCVYFDATPLVDMLTAFRLHLAALGGEERLLRKANLYGVFPEGERDPDLLALAGDALADATRPWPARPVPESHAIDTDLSEEEKAAKDAAMPGIVAALRDAAFVPPCVFDVMASPPLKADGQLDIDAAMDALLLRRRIV